MSTIQEQGRRVLLSTVSSDAHTWNLVFLQLFLEEQGYEVVNLGPCVPDELLLSTARRHQPDAIAISSVNGHGYLDGERLIRALRADPQLARIPTVIGGKLGLAGGDDDRTRALIEAGFDAVFTDSGDPLALHAYLRGLPTNAPAPSMGDRNLNLDRDLALSGSVR